MSERKYSVEMPIPLQWTGTFMRDEVLDLRDKMQDRIDELEYRLSGEIELHRMRMQRIYALEAELTAEREKTAEMTRQRDILLSSDKARYLREETLREAADAAHAVSLQRFSPTGIVREAILALIEKKEG